MAKSTVSVRVDPKLWKEVKKKAIDSDISVSEAVERALKRYFNITKI